MRERERLDSGLRALAARLERETPPVEPETVMRRGASATGPSRWRPLAGVAAAAVLLAVVLVATRPDDGDRDVSTTDTPTTEAVPPTTTTSEPARTEYRGVPFEELPATGIAVVDGDRVLLLDYDGTELAEATTPAASDVVSGGDLRVVAVRPDPRLDAVRHDDAEAPPGCERAAGGGGVRVALCGGEPQLRERIVIVEPTGETTDLAGPAPGSGRDPDGRVIGHWRWAVPSPDGRWVLAQWSDECEVPIAFLIPVDGGGVKTAAGEDGLGGAVTSIGVGWSPDGRAVVHFREGLCSSGLEEPGTYLVDAGSAERTLVDAQRQLPSSTRLWRLATYENEPERRLRRALAELGLEGCCGEPSHGGAAAAGGARWQGYEIPLGGAPASEPPTVPFNDLVIRSEPIEIGGAPATAGEADLGPFVAFTCGAHVWTVGGVGAGGDRASDAAVRSLAESLLPHLYCTVAERPAATGHGSP